MTKKIELMTDYYCHPLWEIGPDSNGDLAPEMLPLQQETIQRLQKWAASFDSILNEDDPAASDFASEEDLQAFEKEGICLWHQLRAELSPDYEVGYFSQLRRKHFTHPRELEVDSDLMVVK